MAEFIGRLIDVGIGKESARGTAVAPTYWLPATAKSVEDTYELAKDEAARGVIETPEGACVTKVMSEGEIEGHVEVDSVGLLLLAVFGSVATTADDPEAGVNTHDFTVAQSAQHQSLTVAMKHPAENIRFANAVVSSFELTAELNAITSYVVGFMGLQGADDTDTVSYTEQTKFCPQYITVKFASDISGLDAAAEVKVKSVTLTINKNVESDDVLGSTTPDDFLNKQFTIEGTIELNYEDTTYKDLALAGTAQALRIAMANTDVTIGSASNPSLTFDLAKVILESWERGGDNDAIVPQTLNFTGYYSVSDASMITAKLINTVASY